MKTNAVELMRDLDQQSIQDRLAEIDRERRALMTLLKAAKLRGKKDSAKKQSEVSRGK